jgi:serine/threonine-protein kinase
VIGKTEEMPDDSIEKGKVIKTDPEAGTTAKEGTKINLYTSSGKKKYELSDYTGRLYDDVVNILKGQDFKHITKTEVYNDNEPAGTIVGQDPPAGKKVAPDSVVLTFKVSKGPKKITLKDLTQYSSKAAQDYAQSEGLAFDGSGQAYSDTVTAGLVISQSPAPGTEMQKGDKVSVIISKGVEEKPPKTVTKEVSIPYQPTDPGKTQEVQIYIEDMNHNLTDPAETISITQDIKKSIELNIQDGKTAEYKVVRDGTVITDEFVNYDSVQ